MIKLALIDLDNTLIDSLSFLERGYKDLISHYQIQDKAPPFSEIVGLSLPGLAALLKEKWMPNEQIGSILGHMESHLERETVALMRPGARQFLSFLKAQKIEMALVSSANTRWIEKHLAHHGIARYFSYVSGNDKEKSIENALRHFALPQEEAILIDDYYTPMDTSLRLFRPDWAEIKEAIWKANYQFTPFDKPPILCEGTLPSLSKEALAIQEEIFQGRQKAQPHLFNGPVLFFERIAGETVSYATGEYKTMLGSVFSSLPELQTRATMAVSARVYFEDKLLIGQRSSHVALDPGHYELVPQGVLSFPDPEKQILTELEEEAHVSLQDVISCRCVGLVYDLRTHLREFVFAIRLRNSEVKLSVETSELFFADPDSLQEKEEQFTSFSHYLLNNHHLFTHL